MQEKRSLTRVPQVFFYQQSQSEKQIKLKAIDASKKSAAFSIKDKKIIKELSNTRFKLEGRNLIVESIQKTEHRKDTKEEKIIVTYESHLLKEDPTLNDWDSYSDELRKFIKSKDSGMVLNADEYYDAKNPEKKSNGKAVFKLHCGWAVKEFVTIWEMFDHGEVFKKCTEKLSIKAQEIYKNTHFSKIVTCTPTAKELANYVLEQIRTRGEEEISIYHFGDYPTQRINPSLPNIFEDERVLILTDIVSSGSLIKNMAEVIIKQGGTPIGLLTIAITNRKWVEYEIENDEPKSIELSKGGARLHTLTYYIIDMVLEHEYDPEKILPVDFVSILPAKEYNHRTRYKPIYTISKLLKITERCKAIDFSFYDFDEKRFTTAFDIRTLLEKGGDEIWQGIEKPILAAAHNSKGKPVVLVTSYKQNDLNFKDFVKKRLEQNNFDSTTVVTLKRGIKDSAYMNLTLGEKVTQLANLDAILVLATLSTSEKLRSIISLLLTQGVRKVIVVCLFNRMGVYATSFISAIERFIRRVKSPSPNKFTDFEFHMIYSYLDIAYEDLAKMHNQIELEITAFKTKTNSDIFKRRADELILDFTPFNFIDPIDKVPYKPLQNPYKLKNSKSTLNKVNVKTQEGKIALITYNLALNHDYKPVFIELTDTFDQKTIIHLLGLILSDIEYLHFNRSLISLTKMIVKRIRFLRHERFSLEKTTFDSLDLDKSSVLLEKYITTEIYLIIALGLIANHEPSNELNDIINFNELLFCDKNPDEWIQWENNLWNFFREDRIFFALAFLLHALYPNFSKKITAAKIKQEIAENIEHFREIFNDYANFLTPPEGNNPFKSLSTIINGNLDTLLTEAGHRDRLDKHQIIRYLHRQVLRPKANHNPVVAGITQLNQTIRSFFEKKGIVPPLIRYPINYNILQKIDYAINAFASLPLIAIYARRLFYFTPSSEERQVRYTNPIGGEGMATDIDDLIELLSTTRKRRKISRSDLNKLEEFGRRILEDFTESFFRHTLSNYVVDLGEYIYRSLDEINILLSKTKLKNLLQTELFTIRKQREKGSYIWPVLCQGHLLHETLKNILFNLRYTYQESKASDINENNISIAITKETMDVPPENTPLNGICLNLISRNGIPPSEQDYTKLSNTIGDQFSKLREFGVIRKLAIKENGNAHELKLCFISRDGFSLMNQSINPIKGDLLW